MPVNPSPSMSRSSRTTFSSRAGCAATSPARAAVWPSALKTTSRRRTFHTPDLEKDQAYYYEVRAEVVRDGKTVGETRKVIVKAGQVIKADFSSLGGDAVKTAKAR